MRILSPLTLCVLGFALLITAPVGFITLDEASDEYWKIALASPPPQTESSPPDEPSHFTLSRHDPKFRRKCWELGLDATGLVGIALLVAGIVMHLRKPIS